MSAARWIRGEPRNYPWPQCRFCGRAADVECPPVACMLCGTVQCFANGAGNGKCGLCSHGYLPGWSRPSEAQTCGYAKCDGEAVAGAPRVSQVCAKHAKTVRVGQTGTLAEHVANCIRHRDSGKGWEHWRWAE